MLLLCFLILNCIPRISALQALPTWVTSAFVQAETFNLANNLTTSATVPSATLVFPTAFTGTPDIAYGVIKY
jgi:hypothetical protein